MNALQKFLTLEFLNPGWCAPLVTESLECALMLNVNDPSFVNLRTVFTAMILILTAKPLL